jgi:flagellar protein FliO/FliZ
MAQQLEAALRRTPAQDSRPPVTDALAVAPTAKVSPRATARDVKPRQEQEFEQKFDAKFEPKREPKFESKFDRPEPKFEPKFEAKPETPTAPDKNIYDNLEEEMASLLGRPPEKA